MIAAITITVTGIIALVLMAIWLLVILVVRRPEAFAITRSMDFAASPETIFPQVNTLRKWEAWSPWAKLDPNVKNTYSGPESGVGAVMNWNGNKKVGAGQMTIIESKPSELLRIRLEFYRPMKAVNTVEFTFKPEGEQTHVTWTMSGKNNFIGKLFHMVMDIDKMVGKDFEKGLASLKSIAEARG